MRKVWGERLACELSFVQSSAVQHASLEEIAVTLVPALAMALAAS